MHACNPYRGVCLSLADHMNDLLHEMQGHCLPVANVLGSVSVIQRAQSLLLTLYSWSNGGYDAGLGAPTKGVPQQPCQFAVTVRNVT